MNKLLKLSFLYLILIVNFSCSKNNEVEISNEITETPEYLYDLAIKSLDNNKYDDAKVIFEDIEANFPLSNEAIQSQIMLGFIEYVNMNYEEAIFKFNQVIHLYPAYKNIDYAYYMRAMCYYEQIEDELLDGQNNALALQNFQQTINRFPNSEYAKDSKQKIILINENIAAKHMSIGLFYLKKKSYLAALRRYKIVIDEFSQSKFTPEALHRLVEIYYILGMLEDAKKTASVLGYNYPDSKWYKYSYKIVGEEN